MAKDVNIRIKADGVPQTKQEIDSVGRSVENLGDTGGQGLDKLNEKTSQSKKSMDSLGGTVKALGSALLAFVSTSTIIAFFVSWLEKIKEISAAQKELAEQTRELDQAAKSLASQANVMGTQKGMEGARGQVATIQKRGSLGSWSMAEAIAVSAHSALGTSGQLLTPEQIAVASVVGGFAQRKGISTGGIDSLFKLMANIGETSGQPITEQYAQGLIQKMSTVQQSSKAKSFEEFMPGAIKSMTNSLSLGATPEMALAQYASALDVSASADLAAEKTKQASALLLSPKVSAAIGGGFEDLPYDQQITVFGSWVAANASTGAGRRYLLKSGISPEQIGAIGPLYSQGQLGRITMFQGLAQSATGAQFRAEAEGYGKTTQGLIEAHEAEAVNIGAGASEEERLGLALIKAGEKIWTRRQANHQNYYLLRDSLEKPTQSIWWPLRSRLSKLESVKAVGRLPGVTEDELAGAESFLQGILPRIADPTTPREFGRADILLKSMENQVLPVVINNNHYGDNYAPIVAPGDVAGPRSDDADRIGY
ncbi:MAG: hypothetical protein JXD22_04915 [Sedimentisphaerales bacterium]|nr:hypothetical protein [Sedimentisphaerales bacterium]